MWSSCFRDIRLREDAYSIFDDDEQIRVSKSGILWKYVEMFSRDQSCIPLRVYRGVITPENPCVIPELPASPLIPHCWHGPPLNLRHIIAVKVKLNFNQRASVGVVQRVDTLILLLQVRKAIMSSSAIVYGKYDQVVVFDKINRADHCEEIDKLATWRESQRNAGHPLPSFFLQSSSNSAPLLRASNRIQNVFKCFSGFSPFRTESHSSPEWPIPHLAKTNGSLSEAETSSLRQAIRELEAQIEVPVPCTSSQSHASSRLWHQQSHLARMRGRLSIVHNLPYDVLQEIFLCGTASRNTFAWSDRCIDSNYPWTLAHVSQFWRSVAFSTPELWTYLPTLYLKGPSLMGSGYTQSQLQHFNFVLNLTKGGLLDVAIHETQDTLDLAPNPVLDLLLEQCNLWRSAQLDIKYTALEYIDYEIKGRLPNLSQLHLIYQQSPKQFKQLFYRTEPWDTFTVAPKLTSIYVRFWQGYHTFTFPPGQVHNFSVHLNGHIGQPAMLEWALGSSGTMKELTLYSMKPQLLPDARNFPNLTLLHIDKAFPGALNAFTAPCLEELVLYGNHPTFLLELWQFLMRSSKATTAFQLPLKRLTLKSDKLTPQDSSVGNLTSIFEYLPHLNYLEMSIPSAPVLHHLASTTPYLPLSELEYVVFRISDPIESAVYLALNAFARSRCELGHIGIEPLKLLMLLPYCDTYQCKEGFMSSYYALEGNWSHSLHSASDSLPVSSPPEVLPTWAGDIESCLPDTKTGGHPVTGAFKIRGRISQAEAGRWITAVQDIKWNEIDIRNYQFSRIYRKLDGLRLRVQNTPSEIKANIDIRSRKDAYLMVDDDEDTRVSQTGILWKYVDVYWYTKTSYSS
ncbi:hypothetical protein BJ165DRAFT_1567353 [Panaeolus papilionaceus]|nr:hypothetical protein BJ165DRAFT_1567353 [Panaeolus papilionaceus]